MASIISGFPGNQSPFVDVSTGIITSPWYRLLLEMFTRTVALTGEVTIFAGPAPPPSGTLQCNGAAVSRFIYANLFAIIGTTYGAGDGVTTFNLPNPAAPFTHAIYIIYT